MAQSLKNKPCKGYYPYCRKLVTNNYREHVKTQINKLAISCRHCYIWCCSLLFLSKLGIDRDESKSLQISLATFHAAPFHVDVTHHRYL